MGYMDQICSACQAGYCSGDHGDAYDGYPDTRTVCVECREYFDARSAKLGAVMCPTCDRRAGNAW